MSPFPCWWLARDRRRRHGRAAAGPDGARGLVRMVQAKGAGYAMSTTEELEAIFRVS